MQNKLFYILILLVGYSAADSNITTSAPVAKAATPISDLKVSNSALSQADSDYNQLNTLKRQAQIREAQDKLNPPKPQIVSSGGGSNGGISETTATSVVVDHSGRAFATLQFIDGSTLNVERGSMIGKYSVTDIDMQGVKIASCSKNKCGKSILIKRAYAAIPYKQGNSTTAIPSQSTQMFSNSSKDSHIPPIGSN